MREETDTAADKTAACAGQLAWGEAACEKATTAAAAGQTPKQMMESTSDPEFSLTVEVNYHGARQAFFAGTHRWAMFATIVFSASAAIPFWGEKLCVLLAAAAAAADIAFDLTGRAQAHADFKRRYFEMVGKLSRGELADFGPRWMVISADEPPLYRFADLIAYRNACISLGRVVPAQLPWYRRALAHVWQG